jgi:hypothetical protein
MVIEMVFKMREKTIREALDFLKPLAEKYEPRQESKWFEYENLDGHIMSFDEDQGTYCEYCAEKRKQELLDDENIEFPRDYGELIISTETSKENENFLNCDSCGAIIECSIIWNEQEINHWLSQKKKDWKFYKGVDKNYFHYQLYKILEPTYGAAEEFKDACYKIAKKVLKYVKPKTIKLKVDFVYKGVFEIEVKDQEKAKEIFFQNVGMTLNGGLQINENEIKNWDVDMHPVIEITNK